MSRVVIHQDEAGNVRVYAENGPTVFWVSDSAPSDRVYRMSPEPIPDGMLDGPVGYAGDGSAAAIRADRAARMIEGRAAMDVIEGDKE